MSRHRIAIANVRQQFSSGDFLQTLARRVAYKTESQSAGREAELRAYLEMEMRPSLSPSSTSTAGWWNHRAANRRSWLPSIARMLRFRPC